MVNRRLLVVIFALAALVGSTSAFGQSERGSITGVVQDTTKGAIPGVAVSVINTDTNATTTVVSSESGAYSAANLPPGPYRIEASLTVIVAFNQNKAAALFSPEERVKLIEESLSEDAQRRVRPSLAPRAHRAGARRSPRAR